MAKQSIQFLEIGTLQPNPFQPRGKIQAHEISDLADSIRQFGILEPLVVAHTPAGYQIIAGERRWRAAKSINLKEVPVVIKETTPRGMLEMALVENVQRVNLSPIERAQAFQQLMRDFGYAVEEVGKKIGKSHAYVSNSLRLLKLPDAVKDGLVGGQISEGHARALLGITDPKVMIEIYKRILKESASVRRAEELVRHHNASTGEVAKMAGDRLVEQIDPDTVKSWQSKIGHLLISKPQLKLSRTKNHTRLIITLKGDPEEAKKDLHKLMKMVQAE